MVEGVNKRAIFRFQPVSGWSSMMSRNQLVDENPNVPEPGHLYKEGLLACFPGFVFINLLGNGPREKASE